MEKDRNESRRLLLFDEGARHYGLPVRSVLRVVRMVALTPVPDPPKGVLGILDLQGRVVPILSINERFDIPGSALFQHQLIFAQTGARVLGFVAHEVRGLAECRSHEIVPVGSVLPQITGVREVLKQHGRLVLVPDLELLLSNDEHARLNQAMEARA